MIDSTIATAALAQGGLDALGRASGQLAARWADGTVTYDAAALTLSCSASFRAPIGGAWQWRKFGAPALSDAAGAPLSGELAVLRFHPQAALRLRRVIGRRFDARDDGRAARPVPAFAVVRGGDGPAELAEIRPGDPPLAPDDAPPGSALTRGTLTFHDEQGLIVDPVAAACLWRDLLRAFPALLARDAGAAGDLDAVCGLASGVLLQLVDPWGAPWADRADRVGLRLGTGSRLAGGLHAWDGELRPTDDDAGTLRFGLAPHGTLDTSALSAPALPTAPVPSGSDAPSLPRQHLRVVAVHLDLHLLGNRGEAPIDGVPGPDADTRAEPAPIVRDAEPIEPLLDGLAAVGAAAEVAAAAEVFAVSPTIATDTPLPSTRTDRWPASPAPAGAAEDLTADHSARLRADGAAAYAGDTADVVLTWPAGALPREAHVRAFPRVDPGPATVPLQELDFARRGDGGAAVVGAGEVTIVLPDPFRAGATPRPADPRLRFDLVVVTRGPAGVRGRLFGGLELPVGVGGVAPVRTATPNPFDAVPLDRRGLCGAPPIGLPPTAPATGADPVLAAFGEAAPREAPRFRTMARNDTVVAGHDGAAWTAVLGTGWLTARSVRADARLGNPGRAAGPEDHAPGLRATGRLAQDLARAALRRTHHLARRLPELDAARWAEPSGSGTGTIAAAVLQTIAATCENPEVSLLPASVIHGLPADWDGLVAALGSALGLSPPEVPAPGAAARWVEEVHREAFAAEHGRRDALWSLRWAIGHARRLVYLETPLFGATAAGAADHEVDLVVLLADRLRAQPDLRVVLALPKRIAFGPGYEAFAQRHHQLRNDAVALLEGVDRDRITVVHPVGFPGRPEVTRGTLVVVDDVWALVGTSSVSRRGLTFDGGSDVVLFDRTLQDGASAAIRDLRRRAMARVLGLSAPAPGATPAAAWVRTRDPRAAAGLVAEIVERGGDGLVEPLWAGLPESAVLPLARELADPDGRGFPAVLGGFVEALAGLGPDRV